MFRHVCGPFCMTAIEPKKAVILAAGMGTRLRSLTWALAKPLVPLWGQPLIARLVAMLEQWGVTEILVNLHWQPAAVRAALAAQAGPARFRFFEEDVLLGTGGALRPMRPFLAEGPFWIVNADIAADLAPAPLLRALGRRPQALAAAWLDPRRGPRTVETDGDGLIATYRSRQPGKPGTATFCGLQAVRPEIFDFFPPQPACSLVEIYERAATAGRPVAGVRVPGSFWDDAGTTSAYLRIHAEVRRRARTGQRGGRLYDPACDGRPQARGDFLCGSQEAAAHVRRCVVWPGARLAPGARLSDVVVAGGVTADGTWRNTALIPVAAAPDPVLGETVARLGWPASETALAFLGERGSNRSFWRAGWGRRRAILVRYTLERPENGRYAGHAALLAEAGVPVPRVLLDLPEQRLLALEDWGDVSLEQRLLRRPDAAVALYAPVLAAAARLHTTATALAFDRGLAMEPAFDAAVFQWEHDLFRRHLLQGRLGLANDPPGVAAELGRTAAQLLDAPRVVVHRDFQSSNVLCRRGRIALIDFQGLRPGPAAYDLASLLCDPYVCLPTAVRQQLLGDYLALCPATAAAVEAGFAWAAVQRLVQALGAYGRLAGLGHARFAGFIGPAAGLLAELAAACDLPALAALAERIHGGKGIEAGRGQPAGSKT